MNNKYIITFIIFIALLIMIAAHIIIEIGIRKFLMIYFAVIVILLLFIFIIHKNKEEK